MFVIVGIMFLGIACGWLLRRKEVVNRIVTKMTLPIIFLLLFVMGVGVGENENIMGRLPDLCGKALIITIGAVMGSLIAGSIVYRLFFRGGERMSGSSEEQSSTKDTH